MVRKTTDIYPWALSSSSSTTTTESASGLDGKKQTPSTLHLINDENSEAKPTIDASQSDSSSPTVNSWSEDSTSQHSKQTSKTNGTHQSSQSPPSIDISASINRVKKVGIASPDKIASPRWKHAIGNIDVMEKNYNEMKNNARSAEIDNGRGDQKYATSMSSPKNFFGNGTLPQSSSTVSFDRANDASPVPHKSRHFDFSAASSPQSASASVQQSKKFELDGTKEQKEKRAPLAKQSPSSSPTKSRSNRPKSLNVFLAQNSSTLTTVAAAAKYNPLPTASSEKPRSLASNTSASAPSKSAIDGPRVTTEEQIALLYKAVGVTQGSTIRPTEAQLRWSHFHKNKRAQETKCKVEALMMYPENVKDVEGANTEDGDTTEVTCSSSEENAQCMENGSNEQSHQTHLRKKTVKKKKRRKKKQAKVQISRGRRALLRVSARSCEERRKINMAAFNGAVDINGQGERDCAANIDPSAFLGDDDIADLSVCTSTAGPAFRAHNAAMAAAAAKRFSKNPAAGGTKISPKSWSCRHFRYLDANEDEERARRFEHAVRAMMASSAQPEEPATPTATDGKRWVRPTHVPIAVSIDGRCYDDLQRTPSIAHKNPNGGVLTSEGSPTEPSDKTASWLVHIPKLRVSPSERERNGPDIVTPDAIAGQTIDEEDVSPGKQKLNQIIWKMQSFSRESSPRNSPREQQRRRASPKSYFFPDSPKGSEQPSAHQQFDEKDEHDIFPAEDGEGMQHGVEENIAAHTVEEQEKLQSMADRLNRRQEQNDKRREELERLRSGEAISPPIRKKTSSSPKGSPLQETLKDNRAAEQSASSASSNQQKSNLSYLSPAAAAAAAAAASSLRSSYSNFPNVMGRFPSPTSIGSGDGNGNGVDDAGFPIISSTHESISIDGETKGTSEGNREEEEKIFEEKKQADTTHQEIGLGDSTNQSLGNSIKDLTPLRVGVSVKGLRSLFSSNKSSNEAQETNNAEKPNACNAAEKKHVNAAISSDPISEEEAGNNKTFESKSVGMIGLIKNAVASPERSAPTATGDDNGGMMGKMRKALSMSPVSLSHHLEPETTTSSATGENEVVSKDGSLPQPLDRATLSHSDPTVQSSSITADDIDRLNKQVMNTTLSTGRDIIDTDETTSDASDLNDSAESQYRLGNLLLSPTILTKRHQQAMKAIELRKWENVAYLLSANPWLAEMPDVRSDQYLLHQLSLYGGKFVPGVDNEDMVGNDGQDVGSSSQSAPEELNIDLINKFPSSVHKFDQDGNLPLHMAASSANIAMIKELGERFLSGASVRNNDGKLPLHLSVMSCTHSFGLPAMESILDMFVAGVFVGDNDKNLPLHLAASSLVGDVGVEVIYMLLDAADKEKESRDLDYEETSIADRAADGNSAKHNDLDGSDASSSNAPTTIFSEACRSRKNAQGQTPLMIAIKAFSGWQMVEALASGSDGNEAAMEMVNSCNALHLLVGDEYADPPSVLSLLKVVPGIASIRNGDGILPIETACMNCMPREVILALALVDLPVDLDSNVETTREGSFGGSWWFLACECDDEHADIVAEILSICSYHQTRELCFMKLPGASPSGSRSTVISRATPLNKIAMRRALRFVGQYEFVGSAAIHSDPSVGLKVFEALDFGTDDEPDEEGHMVLLRCYGKEEPYLKEVAMIKEINVDPLLFEERSYFAVHEFEAYSSANAPRQFCIAVERPTLTLDRVVAGMPSNNEYRKDPDRFQRYLSKVSRVLRLMGKSLRTLHEKGVVHGDVSLHNCGKFGDHWKLVGTSGARLLGESFGPSRMGESSPPEAVVFTRDRKSRSSEKSVATFHAAMNADPSVDIWAFGKMMYEALTGESLIYFNPNDEVEQDQEALTALGEWDEGSLCEIVGRMEDLGIGMIGVDLITHCLAPFGDGRPRSMQEVLKHPFWKDTKRKGKSSSHLDMKISLGRQRRTHNNESEHIEI